MFHKMECKGLYPRGKSDNCRLDWGSSSAVGCHFVLLGLQMLNARSQGIQSDRFTQTRTHSSYRVFGNLRWYKVGGESDDW
jgi:hypothetical protein